MTLLLERCWNFPYYKNQNILFCLLHFLLTSQLYFASKEKGWFIKGISQQKSRSNDRGEHCDSVHRYSWILSFLSASTFRIELWNRENQECLKCLNNADKSDQFILNSLAYFMKSFCQNLLWTLYYTWENFRRIVEIDILNTLHPKLFW